MKIIEIKSEKLFVLMFPQIYLGIELVIFFGKIVYCAKSPFKC